MTGRFQQLRPAGEEWELQPATKRDGALVYRNRETGDRVQVPSVWYNQSPGSRTEAMEFYAARADECARYWRHSIESWAPHETARHEADARRLRELASRMRETGEVLA